MRSQLQVDELEDRKLMSFGGGSVDYTVPRLSTTSPSLNFTSNTFYQINNSIPGVAQSILNTPSGTVAQLTSYVARIPNGASQLLPILEADLNTFKPGASVTSAEATVVLDTLYQQLLGRSPDVVGLTYDIPALVGGTSVAQVAEGIVSLQEFISNNTSTTNTANQNQTQFVTALYSDVLGRAPDAGGLAYWVNAINSNTMTNEQVAVDFVASSEASTSSTSILQQAAFPAASTPSYYYGSFVPGGPITGNFAGTTTLAQVENLIQQDTLTYLGNGIGTSFNVLKSHVSWTTDKLLTFNGRVS